MRYTSTLLTLSISLILSACGSSGNSTSTPLVPPTTGSPSPTPVSSSELAKKYEITTVPDTLSGTFKKSAGFDRYTALKAPNGKAIHIVAQNKISELQIVRAKNILTHYLTNYAGSLYRSDKGKVANAMTNNNATLMLLNGQDDGTNPASSLPAQPLYQNEIQVEGGAWYIAQNYEHRDASFEEILHLVHDTGIGVDANASFVGVLPNYQAEIRAAQQNALATSLWGKSTDWINELTAENSLSQEYFAAVIDSYYGLWGAWKQPADQKPSGMWGEYVAKTRADIAKSDPEGAALPPQFFQPYLTYNAPVAPEFSGTFSLKFDASLPYTNPSQYLKDVTLLGTNPNKVVVNQFNNNITGNSGENTVIFSGSSNEYSIDKNEGKVIITDQVDNRDGVNTLTNIEIAQFTDTNVTL